MVETKFDISGEQGNREIKPISASELVRAIDENRFSMYVLEGLVDLAIRARDSRFNFFRSLRNADENN